MIKNDEQQMLKPFVQTQMHPGYRVFDCESNNQIRKENLSKNNYRAVDIDRFISFV